MISGTVGKNGAKGGDGLAVIRYEVTEDQYNAFPSGSGSGMSCTGGTISYYGDRTVHTFTSPGNFTVNTLSPNPSNNTIFYLVVGGGGGGGCHVGGGGGAGGLVSNHPTMSVLPQQPVPSGGIPATGNYAVTVGTGGAGTNANPGRGTKGNFSSINSLAGGDVTAYGGGGGGSAGSPEYSPAGSGGAGPNTGSGGGTGHGNPPQSPVGNPVSPGTQGFRGGGAANPHQRGGGGGGAAEQGTMGGPFNPGFGGKGLQVQVDGRGYYWAGGGGGGKYTGTDNPGGDGGFGGGGGGGSQGPYPAYEGGDGGPGLNNGTNAWPNRIPGGNAGDNTGGGGGGSGHPGGTGGTGGPGVVVISYVT